MLPVLGRQLRSAAAGDMETLCVLLEELGGGLRPVDADDVHRGADREHDKKTG